MASIRETVGQWVDTLHKKLQADYDKESKKEKPSEYKSAYQQRRENLQKKNPPFSLGSYE